MNLEALLSDDDIEREAALEAAWAAPEHARAAFAAKVVAAARDAAAALESVHEIGEGAALARPYEERFARACVALSVLRVETAKSALLRIADEAASLVKTALARALSGSRAAEGRAVLVHLLSDDDARPDAILAIGAAPWPEVLPALIEVAEGDDEAARLAAIPIATCGATAGPKEANAAADFLLEQLDDDVVMGPAALALLRLGERLPGIAAKGRLLAKEPGRRKICGLCLVAAYGDEGKASFLELALAGTRTDEAAARAFLRPLLGDAHYRVRSAAERTWQALDLGP